MKKLVVISVLFILAAGAVFAQMAPGLWMNAWGRAAFVPLWYNTPEAVYGKPKDGSEGNFKNGVGVTWDPNNQPRVDFRIHGANDFLGFTIHVNSEYIAGTGNGDNGAQIWIKPFGNEDLKLTAANQFIDDTLRGKVSADTGFENFVLGKSMMNFSNGREPLNQDVIFNRFAGGRGSVAAANASNTSTHISLESVLPNVFFLSSSPIRGMFAGLMLQGQFPQTDLKESWRQVHVGAGYEIPGVGHARAQYIGGFMGKEKAVTDMFRLTEPSKFELAFAYTALRSVLIDAGVKIWMPVIRYNDTASYRGIDIGIGAAYRSGPFNITGMLEALYLGAYTGSFVHTATDSSGANGAHLTFNLIPSYELDFGAVGLSLILQTKTADKGVDPCPVCGSTDCAEKQSAWTRFGVGGWYKKSVLGGYLKMGVTYAPPPIKTGHYPVPKPGGGGYENSADTRTGFNGPGIVTIPIIFEYAFF